MLLPRYFGILFLSVARFGHIFLKNNRTAKPCPSSIFLVNLVNIVLVGSNQRLFTFCLGLQEPLRVALLSHLRSLVQNLISNSETTEQISQILVNDNLDLGCALTETVATRKVTLRHS